MKPAMMLLATTLVVSGCRARCDITDIALFWHFPDPGGGELSCSQAGVASVRITIDGSELETVGCTVPDQSNRPAQGVTLTNFFDRPYQFQVDGLNANGTPIYSDVFTFTPRDCGLQTVDRTLTALGADLDIAYSFAGGANCTTPSSPQSLPSTYIWFHLTDQDGNLYDVDGRTNPTSIPCGSGGATIVLPNAPYGQYTLQGIEEVEIGADNSVIVWHYNCVQVSFQHAVPGDVFDTPPMAQQVTGGRVSCF